MALFTWLWNLIQSAVQLIFPMFGSPSESSTLKWVFHGLLLGGALIGLYFLGLRLDIGKYLGKAPSGFVKDWWLPLLGLMIYLMAWFGWWLWQLLQGGGKVSPFPDLDAAWAGIGQALFGAGIDPQNTPIFVVLGDLESPEAELFAAMPLPMLVNGLPGPGAPLRCYASREAIYLVFADASLLGAQVRGAAGQSPRSGPRDDYNAFSMDQSIGMGGSIGMSMGGGQGDYAIGQVQAIIRAAREQGRALSDAEKQQIKLLSDQGEIGFTPRQARGSVLSDPYTVQYQTARLTHVCGLLREARGLLCPINGIVLRVSITAADTEEDAREYGLIANRDLRALQAGLRILCPLHVVVGDLDRLPGYEEFAQRFDESKRKRRLGKGLPVIPDIRPDEVEEVFRRSTQWIFSTMIPYQTFLLFQLETPNVQTPAMATEANGRMFEFLSDLIGRADRMATTVARAVVVDADTPPMLAGVYVVGTALPGMGEPPFARDWFRKVEGEQGVLSWTAAAFAEDSRAKALTLLGWAGMALLLAGVAVLAVVAFGKAA